VLKDEITKTRSNKPINTIKEACLGDNRVKLFKHLTIWPGLAASQVFLPQQQDLSLNPKIDFKLWLVLFPNGS